MNTNILVLSAGTRNKIVQYLKKALNGKGNVIATDCSNIAPAIYEADRYYIVPVITADDYIKVILNICKEEQITGVFSLIDPELSLLQKHVEEFKKIGVTVIGSSYELCEMSLDKYKMYMWMKSHNYLCAKTYIDKDDFQKDIEKGIVKYPVFVKPRFGSASIAINKAYDKKMLDFLFSQENMIIQEFMDGQEIGADCYIDMKTGEVVSIFTKKKLVMRAGETDKAISFADTELFELLEKFIKEAGFKAVIDIDIFKIGDSYYISEINPRFGGGYPHAYECGLDYMQMIIQNLRGKENKKQIGNYDVGVYMMKYNEVSIKYEDDI